MRLRKPVDLQTIYLAEEWHDDEGCVIWYHLPVCEPPYVGAGPGQGERKSNGEPTDCAKLIRQGYLTHWSRLPRYFDSDGLPEFPSPKAARTPVG